MTEGFTLYFSFIKSLRRGIHSGSDLCFSPDQNLTSPAINSSGRGGFNQTRLQLITTLRWETDGTVQTKRTNFCLYNSVLVLYLPVLAVLQSVADLVFSLEQEVFESRRSFPANTQLVLQLPDSTHSHTWWRICSHWRKKRLRGLVTKNISSKAEPVAKSHPSNVNICCFVNHVILCGKLSNLTTLGSEEICAFFTIFGHAINQMLKWLMDYERLH